MGHYLVFQRNAQDRKVLGGSGYPWAALLFSPVWAFRNGLILHGAVLAVLYATCAVLMGVATNGVVLGVAIALWLGVFTAHNATEWLASSYERRGYRMTGGVAASSSREGLRVGGMLIVGLAMLVVPGNAEADKKPTVTITGEVQAAEKRGDKVVLVFIEDAEQGEFVVLRGTALGKELAKLVGQEVRASGYTGKALRERKFERFIDVLEYEILSPE